MTVSDTVKSLQDLELGSKIAAELHRPQFDLVAGAEKRHLHAILAKDQRAGRNAQRAGVVGEVETHLGKRPRLQQVSVLSAWSSTSSVREVLLIASAVVATTALNVLSGYCGKMRSAVSPARMPADISCGT